ncbi:hypothetical protein [Streptomyces sp. NPDC050704]|uniref:hypothetical protein n=1 Tax=Streptomyces sp. NPDC050704 TaxID=3157219 RepID=UPI00342AFD34
MAETVEIRVHGVSGTVPQSLLEIESIRQVDGDDTARFFRHSPMPSASGTRCEAFHWGTMTSGSVSKALWLLMAPFGVINLARYTLPMESRPKTPDAPDAPDTPDALAIRARQVADVVLRLLGLVMTVLLVTAVAFVSIDLIAWQCGGARECARRVPLIGRHEVGWSWRLALGAAVPAAAVWLLGSISTKVYLHPAPLAEPPEPGPSPGPGPGPEAAKVETKESMAKVDPVGALDQREFWSPSPRTALLRLLHLTTALAVVTMLVSHLSTHQVDGLAPAYGWSHTALRTLFWVALAIAGWCLVATAAGHALLAKDADAAVDPSAVPAAYRWLNRVAWAVFAGVVVIAACWGSRAEPTPQTRLVSMAEKRPERLTGFDWAFQAHYAAAALLLVVLAAANFALSRRSPARTAPVVPLPYRRMWSGMACTVLTGFAVLLATGFTSGFALQTARLLGHADRATPAERQPLELPDLFHVTALLWGLLVVPLALAAAVLLACHYLWPGLPKGMDLVERIRADYPARPPVPSRTVKGIGAAWRGARLKYRLPFWLASLGIVGAVASAIQGALAVVAVVPGRDPGPDWIRRHVYGTSTGTGTGAGTGAGADTSGREDFFSFCSEVLGTWVLTGIAVGLAFLGLRAFRSPSWRRSVGILWDLLAFWPRLTHPIVPPPYGGRAVLALAQRIEDKTRDGGKVVLSGHSQGSLICVAAALTVTPGARERLALVTHGSQLMWAYARLFPAYVGHATLNGLYRQLSPRWRNLHRWSDYIGGPVLAHPERGLLGPAPTGAAWRLIDGTSVNGDGERDVDVDVDGVWLRKMGDEYQLRDPHNVNARDGHPASPLLAHSSYYADPAYDVVVRELVASIGSPDSRTVNRTSTPPA